MKKILIIHGPNLNLLGEREPGIYGSDSMQSINQACMAKCESIGYACECFQSNSEGTIIDCLHAARNNADAVVINAGAYTHYSIAIRDAIAAIRLPVIEIHMSNVHKRDEFRHKSVISAVCAGVIAGFGKNSYLLGIEAAKGIMEQ